MAEKLQSIPTARTAHWSRRRISCGLLEKQTNRLAPSEARRFAQCVEGLKCSTRPEPVSFVAKAREADDALVSPSTNARQLSCCAALYAARSRAGNIRPGPDAERGRMLDARGWNDSEPRWK